MNSNDRKKTVPLVAGIDLAGSPKRNTGVCLLRGKRVVEWKTLFSNEEILEFIDRSQPHLIAIDAPLNLPPGRKSLDDKNGEHFRPCDRELLKRGIRFFPITLGPMRMLTERGIMLKKKFTRRGFDVIEMYPGAAQDVWKTGRKQDGLPRLRRGLERLGVRGLDQKMNGDELDAVTGALVGFWYIKGKAEVLGNFKEGAIIIPLTVA
ncbi:MAG TPA: DUF429 domain-containing protein [Bacteroidota bacterium]|nr:DUF429 domain-containing protein [Bacteroidota bacterium]